jgi:hypothetical protein
MLLNVLLLYFNVNDHMLNDLLLFIFPQSEVIKVKKQLPHNRGNPVGTNSGKHTQYFFKLWLLIPCFIPSKSGTT